MSCDYEMNPQPKYGCHVEIDLDLRTDCIDECPFADGIERKENCNYWRQISRPCRPYGEPAGGHDPNAKIRTQDRIAAVCDEIKALLLEKNLKYGDSALNPKRIFSKADTIEQLNVRIDDKLSRIATLDDPNDEDTEADLIGYLILRRVARGV